ASTQRDCFVVPDIKTALDSLRGALNVGTTDGIKTAFKTFENVVKTSPDVLSKDGLDFIDNIKSRYKIQDE
ncbi:MAG: hypothetical protein ABSE82_15565, partial [Nitrososphaerales archaeon]